MKYIASCSFGKDSLAMLIKIKECGLSLDEVIFCDIKFTDAMSGLHPLQEAFIAKAETILQNKFGIKVTHICGKPFKELFYIVKQKGNHIGEIYGFPLTMGAWCNDRLKIKVINQYLKQQSEPIHQYVGIAYDEPERHDRLGDGYSAPLYDLGITEREAYEICKQHDLLSPLYSVSFRDGCWFCPKQPLSSLYEIYTNYPHLWQELRSL